ncbi:MAG: bifunctional [glutamine synthetase] adenylyltransferase/[glutamine synthetase]-adenylyl-L-tyrosine phosphorylase [Methylovirgula sp.]|nr:bifunctional [glutamine synthetase] adenylyltransferase/[glutamine synthetase]-adenylyl-L-tyrosine phosphorylase [Methylovirgula sp.]
MQTAALPLYEQLVKAPEVSNPAVAQARLADFAAGGRDAAALAHAPAVAALLRGIADHSPYLWKLIAADPARLLRLLSEAPDASLAACLDGLDAAVRGADSEAAAMRLLRRAKQAVALLIALADLGGAWTPQEVMAALTKAADVFVASALSFILRDEQKAGRLLLPDATCPDEACGLVILALGKHGAGELNYSSDTDLIILFDPASATAAQMGESGAAFVRIARRLVKLLQERTADGYVLRVDLRLRPDPGSTAIAISTPAAFFYYESFGQNWERAAMIKARPIAGDRKLGEAFLEQLTPFIWRRYFDYAAIADIHAMKRQIHAVRGHAEIAVAGHDLKLGRGGIREIEFFVQTQQLIYGGRRPQLRGRATLPMLDELHEQGLVSRAARDDLHEAYLYLRELEHRLQMIADEQTQRLPAEVQDLSRFANFCGYATLADFSAALTHHLERVAEHYAMLFETAPGLSAATGNLVFTGVSDDPETLETLTRLGFQRPALVAETIRGWHFGRRVGVSSERAREVLTELIPALLEAFAESADPDAALAALDHALAQRSAAVELLSILKSNAGLRKLFADLLGSAPRLAEIVVRRPHVLDSMIDRDLLTAQLGDADFDARLRRVLASHTAIEDVLDALRDFRQEESFLIGLRLLTENLAPDAAGAAYAALAGAVVRACLFHVEQDFVTRFGQVPQGRCVVLGMGKLGSREMTAASDLDLILIYDFDENNPEADGAERLHATHYYTRLSQRLISGLTVATRRGRLYDVDMRLRPSGRKGPVASQLSSFVAYQAEEAETWEHMALTRARVIAGDVSLTAEVVAARERILRRPPTPQLRKDVAEMRRLVAKEKGESDRLDLKYAAGGQIDLDFLAQYLSLRSAHEAPAMLATAPADIIVCAGSLGFLTPGDRDCLLAAYRLYTQTAQVLHTILEAGVPLAQASEPVKQRLATAAGLPSFAQLEAEFLETEGRVRAIFKAVVG